MTDPVDELTLIATTTFGLEALAARELEALGYEASTPTNGRVVFAGPPEAICAANLWLRTADRVLLEVGRFPARDFDELFEGVKALPWERWIPPDGAFPVVGRSVRSRLFSVPACQRAVNKAVAERLLAAHGVGELPENGATYRIEVSLLDDEALLTIDTTGPGLNKRGYRPVAGPAPLKETLAAALVQLSFWTPERPFLDPLCGTGTICIEAAMIGRNIAPGLDRTFAAEDWPALPADLWADARRQARQVSTDSLPVRLVGTDRDERAIRQAMDNARRAGVADDIHFQQREFADVSTRQEYGCLICNPPYGRRLGDQREAQELYRLMPEIFRRLTTWSLYVLTSEETFEQIVGRGADRRRKLYNGRIECTYYQFHGPRPPRDDERPRPKAQIEPAFGGLDAKAHEQAEMFANRLSKRAHHLRRWPTKMGITCYRLYDRDIPEVPLIVDRYEDHLHLAEVERPHDRTPAEHADWLDLMVSAAAKALEVEPAKVFCKRRSRQRGTSQYEKLDDRHAEIIAREGNLQFLVNLSDYLDTGLFLDHRITRGMVRDEAESAHVLNLFCYTGSFTVYAAAGGAKSTTSVDLSNTYLDWARRNLELNGFASRRHRMVHQDVLTFLHRDTGGPYDLAVVDPPTFSNSKSADRDWDVQRHHGELLNRLIPRMRPGGIIYFSTNSRRFRLDEQGIHAAEVRDITRQTLPDDFRNQRIHKAFRILCPGR